MQRTAGLRRGQISMILRLVALIVFAVPAFGQGTAIEPCPATPRPAKPGITATPQKVGTSWKRLPIDAGIPNDPEVEKIMAPYTERVRELSKVIGRLEAGLKKTGVGAGSLGQFVTDGVRAQAQAKLGKPVVLAFVNAGGLRKNEIAAGEVRASDIFELLPFENALIAVDL